MTEYQSKPVTVQAVQIPNASSTTILNALAFGFGQLGSLEINGAGDVAMTTIQGQVVSAAPGEYVVQEQDDPTRFYPVAPEVFERRYEEVSRG